MQPKVTIGLPVYNGENFLAVAIESVLAQSYSDWELVICDNASTDHTLALCESYAAKEPRLKILRSERNLGAAANYNRVFEAARGTYFKWEAHDDALLPQYLKLCVAALDAEPDAVACNGAVEYIDSQGNVFGTYRASLEGTCSDSPAQRFAAVVLNSHPCNDFFALLRRDRMQKSLLHGSYHGADRAFIAEMALRGKLLHLPEPLLQMREHEQRYTRASIRPEVRRNWHAGAGTAHRKLPTLELYSEYRQMVREESMSDADRKACESVLRNWWLRNYNAIRVSVDWAARIDPRIVGLAERIKYRIFGPPAGPLAESTRKSHQPSTA